MSPTKAEPRWATYEQQVFELFKEHFPDANVRKNVRVKGRLSKRKRQIDVLVSENTPAGPLKTVVDAKSFKRKVDVKAVDGLAGFVKDVGAQRGMLVTSRGYTKAALNRAFYDNDLELDILNFSALQQFQGFAGIPYSGKNAFLVPAPFGWIVDATQGEGYLASMYQRGIGVETAKKKMEFLYVNCWNRVADPLTAEELDEHQVASMRSFGAVAVSHRPTVQRSDAVTRLRIADVKEYNCLEVTGFLEFHDVIFFAVLLTPRERQRSNIRRLESVLRQAIPMKVKYDNAATIAKIQEQLRESLAASKRAFLLRKLGRCYREMDQFDEARLALEQSLPLDPGNAYHIIRELLPVLAKLGDRKRAKELMSLLLRLDPRNPTVFNDCFTFGSGWIERSELLTLFDTLKVERAEDQFVQANCNFYSGNLLVHDKPASARKRFIEAKNSFRGMLPSNHQVFRALRVALRECPRAIRRSPRER